MKQEFAKHTIRHCFRSARGAHPAPREIDTEVDLKSAGSLLKPDAYCLLRKNLIQRIDQSCGGRHLVRQELDGLPVPSDVIGLLRDLMDFADASRVGARAIADVWLNFDRIERTRCELPSLWQLVGLAAFYNVLLPGIDPMQQVRRYFQAGGVNGRVWRLVAAEGCGAIRGICLIAARNRLEAIVRWCAALSGTDADWLPPANVIAALYVSEEPNADGRRPISKSRWNVADLPFLRAALREAKACSSAGTLETFLRDDLLYADAWLRELWPVLDANQQRGGWRWIMRQLRRWQESQQRRRANNAKPLCDPVVQSFASDGYVASALTTSLDLWQEAWTMRNCLRFYDDQVYQGGTLIYSICNAVSRTRAASVEFRRRTEDGSRWEFVATRAFANAPTSPDIEAFCRELESEINAADPTQATLVSGPSASAAIQPENSHAPYEPPGIASFVLDSTGASAKGRVNKNLFRVPEFQASVIR